MVNKIPTPHVRLSDLNELKQFLTKQKKIKVRKSKLQSIIRVKRSFLDRHRSLVVRLRYDADFIKIRTWKEISELTGIGPSTLIEMIKNFHTNGNSVKRRFSPGRPPWPIPPEVEAYIKENLEENAFQSSRFWC